MGVFDLALAGALGAALPLLTIALLRVRASDRRHRRLVDNLPQTIVTVFGHDLRVAMIAGPGLREAAMEPRDAVGKPIAELVPAAKAEALVAHCEAALRGEKRSFEYHAESTGRDYWIRTVPLPGRSGEIEGGLSVALDITDRSQIERDLLGRAADVDAVTDATRALARSVDPDAARRAVCDGASRVANAPVAALFEPARGRRALVARASVGADLRGIELPLDGHGGAAIAFTRTEETFISLGEVAAEADRELMRRAGARAVLWRPVVRDRVAIGALAIAWREELGGVSPRLSGMIDLLAAEAAVAIGRADLLGQLEHLARTDGLTGLPNRRHWEQQLPRELARAWRDQQPLCVAMLDLDHFKAYNDRRGHQAGDRLLAAAAGAWRGTLRPYDILARYGGEEFAVILPGCSLRDAAVLVERLRAETPEGETCSAGIAAWDGSERAEALVGRADAALYSAKRSGRDRAVTAAPAP